MKENISSKNRILATIIINLSISIIEIVGGILSNSIALLSDALHNASDTFAGILTFFTIRLSEKKPNHKFTFGYLRAEILSAFINSSFLLVIALLLIRESIYKFINPAYIKTEIMIPVAIFGLIANGVSVIILHSSSHKNINIRSAYLHLFSDTISSIGVVISSLIIHFFKLYFLDPLFTIIIAVYMLYECYKIIKESTEILLESSPSNININKIEEEILKIGEVENIHHVHVWRLNDNKVLFEAHINIKDISISKSKCIRKEIEKVLEEKFNIDHCTIQFEYQEHLEDCLLHNK